MKLTHPDVWHCYAGGTFAAPDKHGYDAYTTIGRYMIQPISSKNNSNRHIGYSVQFCNEKGKLTGGLYQPIDTLTDLRNARKLCQNHMQLNNGELVPEQIPTI